MLSVDSSCRSGYRSEEKFDDNLQMMQDNPADRILAVIENVELGNLPCSRSRLEALRKTAMLRRSPVGRLQSRGGASDLWKVL